MPVSPGNIKVNGHHLRDGEPFFVNGSEPVEFCYVNNVEVYRRWVQPQPITNFSASDCSDNEDYVKINFTESYGNPPVQHDLRLNGTVVASDVQPGYMYSTHSSGTFDLFLHNSEGSSSSNSDSGGGGYPPSAINNLSATDGAYDFEVVVTWTDSVGCPGVTHKLYMDGNLVASNVSSSYTVSVSDDADHYFEVEASNKWGTIVSNGDIGWGKLPGEPPGVITDFSASDGLVGKICISFSYASGDPAPTYELYVDGNLYDNNPVPGKCYDVGGAITISGQIRAINTWGESWSNVDEGSCTDPVAPPGYQEFYYNGGAYQYFTVPAGYNTVTACVVGGGGGGGASSTGAYGGGPAPQTNHGVSTYPGEVLTILVGLHGSGGSGVGYEGGQSFVDTSTFTYYGPGGSGGGVTSGYEGNGGTHPNCIGGVSTDGYAYISPTGYTHWGGIASIGDGGSGVGSLDNINPLGADSGGLGAGGGAGVTLGGNGGDGYVRISWG